MAKKSTFQRVADTVKDAASAVVHAAEENVVEPVGKALGLITKEAEPILLKPTQLQRKRESNPRSDSAIRLAQKTLVKDIAPKGGKKARMSKKANRTDSTKQKMTISTNAGKVRNSRPGAGRAR